LGDAPERIFGLLGVNRLTNPLSSSYETVEPGLAQDNHRESLNKEDDEICLDAQLKRMPVD
jgi:hypothetical protein